MAPGHSRQQPLFSPSSTLSQQGFSFGLAAPCSPSPHRPIRRLLPLPKQRHHRGLSPLTAQHPRPSWDPERVTEIVGKQWHQGLARFSSSLS